MDSVKAWAVSACTVAVVCTLLYRLFPDTAVGRQGRLLLPCVCLCVLLTPLLSLTWSPPAVAPPSAVTQPSQLEARVRQQTVAQLNATLLAMVNQALESYGYRAEKIVTDMDIDATGRIDMGQITVYVDRDTARRSSLVKQVAEQRLGMRVTVALLEDHGS